MRRYAGLAVVGMVFVSVLVGCGCPGKTGTCTVENEPACNTPAAIDDPTDGTPVDATLGSPKNPVALPKVGKIKVDGKLGDWAKIKATPMPFMKAATGPVKLAWNAKGLYGAITVTDKELAVDPESPWKGDCVELWLEKDAARDFGMSENASQIIFVADPESKTGDCLVVVPQGSDDELDGEAGIVAKWKKTAAGYVIEFLVPAKTLAPAKMAAGTKVGLNFALSDAGKPTAQFYCDKNTDEAFKTPELWGTAVLKK